MLTFRIYHSFCDKTSGSMPTLTGPRPSVIGIPLQPGASSLGEWQRLGTKLGWYSGVGYLVDTLTWVGRQRFYWLASKLHSH